MFYFMMEKFLENMAGFCKPMQIGFWFFCILWKKCIIHLCLQFQLDVPSPGCAMIILSVVSSVSKVYLFLPSPGNFQILPQGGRTHGTFISSGWWEQSHPLTGLGLGGLVLQDRLQQMASCPVPSLHFDHFLPLPPSHPIPEYVCSNWILALQSCYVSWLRVITKPRPHLTPPAQSITPHKGRRSAPQPGLQARGRDD